jgi:hypothetical protein
MPAFLFAKNNVNHLGLYIEKDMYNEGCDG